MLSIYVGFVVTAVLVALLSYTSRLSRYIKAITFSSLITLGLFTEGYYRDQLGSSIEGYPDGEFVYVHHVIVGDSIKLWIWTEERNDRLYVLPYDQETAEKLQEAKERTEGGHTQQGEFQLEDDGGNPQPPSLEVDHWTGESSSTGKD